MSQSSRKIALTPSKDIADPELVRMGMDGGISPKFKLAFLRGETIDQEKVRMGTDGGISPKFKVASPASVPETK